MAKTHRKQVNEKSKSMRRFKHRKQDIPDEQDFLYEDDDDFYTKQDRLAHKIQEKTKGGEIPCFREGEDPEFDRLLNEIFGDPE